MVNYKDLGLVNTREMFKNAMAGKYAIAAFNFNNMEQMQAIIQAAVECKSPVILQVSSGARKYANQTLLRYMAQGAVEYAKELGLNIPITLHLDHGDSFELCKSCIDGGFTSVMIDASSKSFEDNIALTKSVADAGRAMGVPVEAELGKVGGKEDDGPAVEGESPYTDPAEAKEFVERTGCTSLAIGVGTSHGVYTSDPHIEQSVVKAIRDAVDVPLVLHGTSGVPDEQVAEAVKNGICKVNYATELRQAYTKGFMAYMAENPACFDPKKPAKEGMREITELVKIRMTNLNSVGKAE